MVFGIKSLCFSVCVCMWVCLVYCQESTRQVLWDKESKTFLTFLTLIPKLITSCINNQFYVSANYHCWGEVNPSNLKTLWVCWTCFIVQGTDAFTLFTWNTNVVSMEMSHQVGQNDRVAFDVTTERDFSEWSESTFQCSRDLKHVTLLELWWKFITHKQGERASHRKLQLLISQKGNVILVSPLSLPESPLKLFHQSLTDTCNNLFYILYVYH